MVEAIGHKNSVLTGTVGSAVVGAGVYGASNLLRQNFLLDNPNAAKGLLKDTFGKALKYDAAGKKTLAAAFENMAVDLEKIVNTGKINWKMAGKAAASGAILIGGLYLAYRGVKAILTKSK